MSYSLLSLKILLFLSLNWNSAFAIYNNNPTQISLKGDEKEISIEHYTKTGPKLNENQIVELKKHIEGILEDARKEEKVFKEQENNSSLSLSSEQQDKLQSRPKKDELPTIENLERNGKDLIELLSEMQKHSFEPKTAKRTMRLAKSLVKKAKKLQERIGENTAPINDHAAAPPHGAKDLERNRSLVVLGLAESTKSKASERLEEDTQNVTAILDTVQMEVKPITFYRIVESESSSKTNSKRPRPIKVVMPTALFRRKVIKSYHEEHKKIVKIKGLEKVIIRRWLNKEQRCLMKKARAELKKRQKNGEKNLVIRNFKVVSADGGQKGEEDEGTQEKTAGLEVSHNHETNGPKVDSEKVEDKDISSTKSGKSNADGSGITILKKPIIEQGATHLR